MEVGVTGNVTGDAEWELHHDEESGQAYYVNIRTGESAWHPPIEDAAALSAGDNIQVQQWTESTDDTGRVYYMNLQTMETLWDPPPGYHRPAATSLALTRGSRRPSTAEEMDHLNALLSGGDDNEEEEEETDGNTNVSSPLVADTGDNTQTVVDDGSEWMMFLNETDGLPYYYNHITGECVWEPPASFLEYHARLSDGAEVHQPDDSLEGITSLGSTRPEVPPTLPSQIPHVPITLEFEDKVRRAIETLSKTPVGSSRVLLVRTPTVKSIDTGRPDSRPSSSSGASARQRVATARAMTEAALAEPTQVSGDTVEEDSVAEAEHEVSRKIGDEPSDFYSEGLNEATELIQREQTLQQLHLEEMALVIQCLVRCFLARVHMARKRKERQLQLKLALVRENARDASTETHHSNDDRLTERRSDDKDQRQQPEVELREEGTNTRPQTAVGVSDQNLWTIDDTTSEPGIPIALDDDNSQPGAEEKAPSSMINSPRLDIQEDSIINPTLPLTDSSESGPSVLPNDASSIETDDSEIVDTETTAATEESQQQVAVIISSDGSIDTAGTPHGGHFAGHNESGVDEMTSIFPATDDEPISDRQSHRDPEGLTPPVPATSRKSASDYNNPQAMIEDVKSVVKSQPSPPRTSAREGSSYRRKDDRLTARVPRARDDRVRPVDMITGPLAILNVSTFFPAQSTRLRVERRSLDVTRSRPQLASTGIQRKPIVQPTQRMPQEKSPEDRATECSKRVRIAEQARAEINQKRTQEAEQLRQLFADHALQFSSELRQLRATEFAKRQAAASDPLRLVRAEVTSVASQQEIESKNNLWAVKLGFTSGDTIKAQVKSATQPHGFIEFMMQKRLNGIEETIRRLKYEPTQSLDTSSRLASWEDKLQSYPSSFGDVTNISNPYWCRLYGKLHRIALSGSAIAQELAASRSDSYDSLLHVAAWTGETDLIQFLTSELNFDVNAIDNNATKTTPLHEASRAGHVEVIEFLLSKGAFLDSVDAHGDTPLHVASRLGWTQVVHRLVAAGELQDESDNGGIAAASHDGTSSQSPRPRVLRLLTWEQCFCLRNYKRKRAVDVAKLPSVVELLTNYSTGLHDPDESDPRDTSSNAGPILRQKKGAIKKKKAKG